MAESSTTSKKKPVGKKISSAKTPATKTTTTKTPIKKSNSKKAGKKIIKKAVPKKNPKTTVRKVRTKKTDVITTAPTADVSPVAITESSLQLPDTLPNKETITPNTFGHLKTWMAAGIVTVGILVVWAFSLQLRDIQPSTTKVGLDTALKDLQVDEFVSDIQDDWSTFQTNVINLEDTTNPNANINSNTNTTSTTSPTAPTTTPSTDELNELFSEPNQ